MTRNYPAAPKDDSHEATGAEYQKECQRLIDQQQWNGTGTALRPEKIIVHEYESSYSDEVQHIYRAKQDTDES